MGDEEPKEIAEKTGGLLPEVFFDVIGRIIPGSILLGLYGFLFNPSLTAIELLKHLLIAYLTGFALDIAINFIFENVLIKLGISYFDDSQRTKWIRGLPAYNRSVAVKMVAEEVLFRSCFVISIITVLFPSELNYEYAFFQCPSLSSLLAATLSAIGFYQIRKGLNVWRNEYSS